MCLAALLFFEGDIFLWWKAEKVNFNRDPREENRDVQRPGDHVCAVFFFSSACLGQCNARSPIVLLLQKYISLWRATCYSLACSFANKRWGNKLIYFSVIVVSDYWRPLFCFCLVLSHFNKSLAVFNCSFDSAMVWYRINLWDLNQHSHLVLKVVIFTSK